jgi:hypothetical protein
MKPTSHFQTSLALTLLGLLISLLVINQPVKSQQPPFDQATPTFIPRFNARVTVPGHLFTFVPKVVEVSDPSNWELVKNELSSKGYEVGSGKSERFLNGTTYGIGYKSECGTPFCVFVGTDFEVSGTQVIGTITQYWQGAPGGIDLTTWRQIDLKSYVDKYGVPDEMLAWAVSTGMGPLPITIFVWQKLGVALQYTHKPSETDVFSIGKLCFEPSKIIEASGYTVPLNGNIYIAIFGAVRNWGDYKPFFPGMLMGVNSLSDAMSVIGRDQCLELPIALFYPEVGYPTPNIIVPPAQPTLVNPLPGGGGE